MIQTAAVLRDNLRTIANTILAREEPSTGLGPGPQADKLIDQLITAFSVEHVRLTQLADLEQEARVAGATKEASDADGPLLAPDLRIESADMAEVLDAFDNTAPKHHATLARQLLTQARRGGAAGDVIGYLTLMADSDVVEGVYTIEWPEHRGLPAPGEHTNLGVEFPEPVRGDVQVVGFGRGEGTLRVRPIRPASVELGPGLDDLGPIPDNMGHDAIEELERSPTPPSAKSTLESEPLDG